MYNSAYQPRDILGAQPGFLRSFNRQVILDLIRSGKASTRAEVARISGLASPTASRIVDSLIADGLVAETGYGDPPRTGGRKPRLLKFNAEAGHVVVLDISPKRVIFASADLDGRIESGATLEDPVGRGFVAGVSGLEALVGHALRRLSIPSGRLLSIGICLAGAVDPDAGTVLLVGTETFSALLGAPLRDRIAGAFGVPVLLEPNGLMAALGEYWRGAGRGVRNLMFVSSHVGLGCGIIVDGKLFRGSGFRAGEIGFTHLGLADLPRRPVVEGFLESHIFGAMLREEVAQIVRRTPGCALGRYDLSEISAEKVFEEAERGDRIARQLARNIMRRIAIGVANAVSVVNPELVIVASRLSQLSESLVPEIREVLDVVTPQPPKVSISELGREATLHGLIARVLDGAVSHLGVSLDPFRPMASPVVAGAMS